MGGVWSDRSTICSGVLFQSVVDALNKNLGVKLGNVSHISGVVQGLLHINRELRCFKVVGVAPKAIVSIYQESRTEADLASHLMKFDPELEIANNFLDIAHEASKFGYSYRADCEDEPE